MEQNLPPLPPVIFENGLYYELRGAWLREDSRKSE